MSSIDDILLSSALYEDLFLKWEKDPNSVDPTWNELFKKLESTSLPTKPTNYSPSRLITPLLHPPLFQDENVQWEKKAFAYKVFDLIQAWRKWGHLKSHINPLAPPLGDPENLLDIETYGFTDKDLKVLAPTMGLLPDEEAPLDLILERLHEIYAGKIGFEYSPVSTQEEYNWFTREVEEGFFSQEATLEEKQMILEQLSKSELFESFMHTKFVGQKRFSLEGSETLIPMMEEAIAAGAQEGVEEFIIGMAHRGRLNVLSNILNKTYKDIFSEFDESYIPEMFKGTGDVKYHKGYESLRKLKSGFQVSIVLSPNPSHLESVDPVVEGLARGRQDKRHSDEEKLKVLPILVHGDAAIAGQGVVYETLQMQGLQGYKTGGTLHFVVNNQIGFTTSPSDGRSTRYCTDIAKAFGCPVIHVNGEDPESAVKAVKLAIKYRSRFKKDVFVDLVCYRKYGHNESDEPAFTQPFLYQKIREKVSLRERYRDQLLQAGSIEKFFAEEMEKEFKRALSEAKESIKLEPLKDEPSIIKDERYTPPDINTAVPENLLKEIGKALLKLPENFDLHSKIQTLAKERDFMLLGEQRERRVDWGMGETLAYATLLVEGHNVRLSGQDVERGTFSHRHAVYVGQKKDDKYIPLQHLNEKQGKFTIYNSHLSEFAVLGFDYGYSLTEPNGLTIWEAQFGDFSNGAQVIIDQYLASSEQKWGQNSKITLLLPHGYEGQGPEHSSGRLERFLTLAGHQNLRICNPTMPHQLFHLLRRQTLDTEAKPLIVFTPKGLLRLPACRSSINDFTVGRFEEIIVDSVPENKIKKIVFCSGKIYYDLKAWADKVKDSTTLFVRLEQLFPLDENKLQELLEQYSDINRIVWAQEEPRNMGAGFYIVPLLERISAKKVNFVSRQASAAPAVGIYSFHKKELHAIMDEVFSQDQPTTFEIAGHFRA